MISKLEWSFDAEKELDPYAFKRLEEQHEEESAAKQRPIFSACTATTRRSTRSLGRTTTKASALGGATSGRSSSRKRKLQGSKDDNVQALEPKSVPA
ncbi:hypothetical protein PF005_g3675 [Phytophthora fragariae]|uniref:Uncharacterized protein n=1 Tax=Phytophthora fragariae TaxID=53985 RepID=A0A6A3EXJ1_9STRA|nr:hypothetical protein PF003_g3513 [Phytophthora fragariae]KAE8938129.1 hypothetical protein PF009_g11989 [Phytophthora fragariae]KAE9010807.1 hypothetical protein PF011_g9662 [Phytophthora fragariae]KAE9112752.1 hypothetical protein PF007_g10991 [Phytophthora fragariae]KAE9113035.1 hypothetical protein PF010_g10231 [Phytophthora fragariae]